MIKDQLDAANRAPRIDRAGQLDDLTCDVGLLMAIVAGLVGVIIGLAVLVRVMGA